MALHHIIGKLKESLAYQSPNTWGGTCVPATVDFVALNGELDRRYYFEAAQGVTPSMAKLVNALDQHATESGQKLTYASADNLTPEQAKSDEIQTQLREGAHTLFTELQTGETEALVFMDTADHHAFAVRRFSPEVVLKLDVNNKALCLDATRDQTVLDITNTWNHGTVAVFKPGQK